eukprot:SAG31_NODE_2811_length_5052_cov_3.554613_5_plen_117_part_00
MRLQAFIYKYHGANDSAACCPYLGTALWFPGRHTIGFGGRTCIDESEYRRRQCAASQFVLTAHAQLLRSVPLSGSERLRPSTAVEDDRGVDRTRARTTPPAPCRYLNLGTNGLARY